MNGASRELGSCRAVANRRGLGAVRLVAVAAALALAAFGTGGCKSERRVPAERGVVPGAGESALLQPTTFSAGTEYPLPSIKNPYDGNVHALQEGRRLYLWFNCAGCHGVIGGGAIGPPLRDKDWIYGGSSLQIYRSIVEGRPNGMPAFRGIPEDSVWKVVAFVRSFGGVADEQPGSPASDPREATREPGKAHEPHGGIGNAESPIEEGNPQDPQTATGEEQVPPAGEAAARRSPQQPTERRDDRQ